MMTETPRLLKLSGQEINSYLDALASLRIEVFREFPYLYDGDHAYEERYLKTYAASPRSVFIVALAGDEVIGVATGLPMADETEEFKRPFVEQGYDVDSIFYFGESVLRSQWRGQGLGVAFIDGREDFARENGFRTTVFCAVQRPPDHPARPADHVPLDRFWENRGYRRQPSLQTTYRWLDVGETEETDKPMMFWMKELDR